MSFRDLFSLLALSSVPAFYQRLVCRRSAGFVEQALIPTQIDWTHKAFANAARR